MYLATWQETHQNTNNSRVHTTSGRNWISAVQWCLNHLSITTLGKDNFL